MANARVIEIAVGQHDEFEIARLAARVVQLVLERRALIGIPRVDEDIAGFSLDEITVHTSQAQGQC